MLWAVFECHIVLISFICFVVELVEQDEKPDGSYDDTDVVPTPKVIIDLDSDPNATIVEITFGDRLGALLDTV